ncbi:MAG: hypothetical protein LBL64_09840 [Treponema sp.]|jgi:hypothetical protein|nr:hypothetical protein [Treponema sp.]
MSAFKSIGDWESALLTLHEGAFFELMRSVFGKIETPFNKQRLAEDLAAFLSRPDIQETIGAYIGEEEALLIAAVGLLDFPRPEDLDSFFDGDFSFSRLQDLILNMEERFIFYRFRDEGISRLALNPVLEKILRPWVENYDILFPAGQPDAETVQEDTPFLAAPGVLAGFIAYVREDPHFFKTEGEFRKLVFERLSGIFPGLSVESLYTTVFLLGLLRRAGGDLYPDEKRLSAFALLEETDRKLYLAAAASLGKNLKTDGSFEPEYLYRGRIRSLTLLLDRFLSTFEEGRLYPLKTLKRKWFICEKKAENRRELPGFDSILDSLLVAGFLSPQESGFRFYRNRTEKHDERIAFDSPLSFVLYPGVSIADALKLASFCGIIESGPVSRFKIDRESALRGFNRGMEAEAMIELLGRLSGNRLDESLIWNLKDWERRSAEVSLYQGVVLRLSGERQYLAETGPLSSFVAKTLAPGIYLLRDDLEGRAGIETAAEALAKAGVDLVAVPEIQTAEQQDLSREIFPPPGNRIQETGEASRGEAVQALPPQDGEKIKEKYRYSLECKKFPKEQREELLKRIERKLIISESQLSKAHFTPEKTEARGLDYAGKANILRQAIVLGSLVEVTWPHPEFGISKTLGFPEAFEKSGSDSVLVLKPHGGSGSGGEPGGETSGTARSVRSPAGDPRGGPESLRIPIAKISLLRRIKKSIYSD